jgi:hypothetical protein
MTAPATMPTTITVFQLLKPLCRGPERGLDGCEEAKLSLKVLVWVPTSLLGWDFKGLTAQKPVKTT